jgi:transposase
MRVFLVNARRTKNLPGRKTDVQECLWLLQLHTFGMLNNSFRPPEDICVRRGYWRQTGHCGGGQRVPATDTECAE